jgi:gliding motility-associated-like protein
MKSKWILLFLLSAFTVKGQEFYINQDNGAIATVNLANCARNIVLSDPLGHRVFGDITFTKNGRLYGVNTGGILYEVNLGNGILNQLTFFPTNIMETFNSMVSDGNGVIYVATSKGNLHSFNPATGISQHHGRLLFGAAGDLIFYKSKLYMAATNNQLIEVNINQPAASSIYMNFNLSDNVFGIVSFSPNCQEVKSYAITSNSGIYEIDFLGRRLIYICQVPGKTIFGAASQTEFNAAAAININQVTTQKATCGTNDGSIRLNAIGGFSALQYSINGAAFQRDSQFINLRNGTYRIAIRDNEGCQTDTIITLQGTNEPIITQLERVPNRCGATQAGSIRVQAMANDSSTLTYSIDSVHFTSSGTFQNLPSGNYNVFVLSSNGCMLKQTVSIETKPKPIIQEVQITPTSCGKGNGALLINTNQTPSNAYSYSLDSIHFQPNPRFTNLEAGNYPIYVSDSFQCTVKSTASIAQSLGIKINHTIIEPTTCGKNNGRLTIDAAWTDNSQKNINYYLDLNSYGNQSIIQNLLPKTYQVIIKNDRNTCSDSATVLIPASRSITVESIKSKNADCEKANGNIYIQATGNGVIQYSLNQIDFQKNPLFTQLEKGDYQVTVRDTQGCTMTTPNILLSLPCFVYIPNVFSPNQDTQNDYFTIYGHPQYVKKVKVLRIFNRFGGLVFESKDFLCNQEDKGWDGTMNGKAFTPDVFAYYAEVELTDNQIAYFKGDVTLVK